MSGYYVGFDIGTDSINAVVADRGLNICHSPETVFHFGNPADALFDIYSDILAIFPYKDIITTAFTGSISGLIAARLGMPFYHDTITIPAGASRIAPEAQYIFHIGAKDPYYFEKERVNVETRFMSFTQDHGTGTKCGGGSGILIARQCRRFFENEFPVTMGDDRRKNREILQNRLKQTFSRAVEELELSDRDVSVGGRCGVVIQSDMIHLQNRGETIGNILKGTCVRIIRNYRSDVLRTRIFDPSKQAIATGGVFASRAMVRMLEAELGMAIDVPENFQKAGAIGAVIKAGNMGMKFKPGDLAGISKSDKESIKKAPPLSNALSKVRSVNDTSPEAVKDDLKIYAGIAGHRRRVLMGMDGGSTTTKAVIVDEANLELIAEICLNTSGRPLQAAQEIFRQISRHLGSGIEITGTAFTGSSGAFYHKLFIDQKKNPAMKSSDIVKDEITCHAFGVRHFNGGVDTIFELGGQDAKFTRFNPNGTVNKSKMNLSCMAGTGQTMQNMAEMIGLDISSTFHEHAMRAASTPVVDDTCGVFTEAGISRLVALGFPRDEIAAAIVYGFMGGYVNKFVGNEKFGETASAQGGPFNGISCLAALAMHTGMDINAFPHRQLFGALGAAIALHGEIAGAAGEGIPRGSKFRGLEIGEMDFVRRTENCSTLVEASCGVKDCMLQMYEMAGDMVYSGGACPKGNTGVSGRRAPDYVAMYRNMLARHLEKYVSDISAPGVRERILIPRSLTFLNEKGVFYTALYKSLGFDIAVSPESDDAIVAMGINHSHSETCYPVKLAHGHAAFLKKHMRKGRDWILLVNAIGREGKKFCPYVAGDGFLARVALSIDSSDALLPVVNFNNPDYPIDRTIYKDLKRVFGRRFSMHDVSRALGLAHAAEKEFLDEIYSRGARIVDALKKRDVKIFLGIGRGYTILDDKASSRIHELFASNGLHFVPSFFIRDPGYDISDIAENMYWYQGARIINYNLLTAMDPGFFPVRETNFNCGADSMIIFHEESIINRSGKPHLVLQTDGHSSNAQFGTRALANFEVVKSHRHRPLTLDDFRITVQGPEMKGRIVGIPYMGENSHVISAAFRSLGYESEVMKTRTAKGCELSTKFVYSNACSPFTFQVGDCLAWLFELKERGIDPVEKALVFQPMTNGPCRFGQYFVILRKFFDECGFSGVPIFNPDSEVDYSNVPIPPVEIARLIQLYFKGTTCNDILADALLRTRPYERESGSADRAYGELSRELYGIVERGSDSEALSALMKKGAERYASLIDPALKRKPIVMMNGEIFVRSHPEANQDSIRLLEKYGLEVRLASLSQWFEYTNKKAIRQYIRAGRWKKLLEAVIKRIYMKRTSNRFYFPFREFLNGRDPHSTEHMIDSAQKDLIYDRLVTGESPISIGEAHMFTRGLLPDISGIYHVGPFGCMHETAATSQINALIQQQRLRAKNMNERIIPFMDAVFGDSELPNLEAEIAAFAEKCYLRMVILLQEN